MMFLLKNFLPQNLILFFKRSLKEILGLLFIGLGIWLSLAIWNYYPQDPSFNTANNIPPINWMGKSGAIAADLMVQCFGFSGVIIILGTIFYGIWLLLKQMPRLSKLRIFTLILSILFIGIFFESLVLFSVLDIKKILQNYKISYPGGVVSYLLLWNLQSIFYKTNFLILFKPLLIIISLSALPMIWYGIGFSFKQFLMVCKKLKNAAKQFIIFTKKIILFIKNKSKGYDFTAAKNFSLENKISLNSTINLSSSSAFSFKNEKENIIKSSDDNFVTNNVVEEETEDNLTITSFLEKSMKEDKTKETLKQKVSQEKFNTIASNYLNTEEYVLPPLELLDDAASKHKVPTVSKNALEESAKLLESVLEEFGIRGEIVNIKPGPVVTMYELKPAPGIKTSRVIGLAGDIARSMSALSARIAVIPGQNVIGIELPNVSRQTVYLKEMLSAVDYSESKGNLPLILGMDIGGQSIIADLSRMPHLLVAGTTGSGKSVSINTMILSLLFKLPPERCKFIMIDPKMLELSIYDDIPHLLTPVVTDPKKAIVALKWAVREMESRYRNMAKLGVRNIDGFNARLEEARQSGEILMRRVQTGFDPDSGKPIFENQTFDLAPLPYIVVVVDEMADLMLVAGKEIEAAVQRLAQMARAAGIHLIMATQRPSVDVITGTIKANFPTRISFQVTSKIDSRTILGEQGAEQLLGQGDMLYMIGGGRIIRVHGPFVGDEEVERIVRFLKVQGEPSYIDGVTDEDEQESFSTDGDDSNKGGDELYRKAVELILREGKASTSFVQRHLQIGYNRAARIIEQMEKEGIISAANHVGKREILS